MTLSENGKYAVCGGGCHKDKKIFSKNALPSAGYHYWEIQKDHLSGCYDSLGVSTDHSVFSYRNGENSSGWAVRLYGNHSDFNFTGSYHDN